MRRGIPRLGWGILLGATWALNINPAHGESASMSAQAFEQQAVLPPFISSLNPFQPEARLSFTRLFVSAAPVAVLAHLRPESRDIFQAGLPVLAMQGIAPLTRTFFDAVAHAPPTHSLEPIKIWWALRRLVGLAEFADRESPGHIQRVSDLSAALATQLGLDSTTVNYIRIASRFHDIGKLRIPHEILAKTGPLTAEERLVIQKHTVYGVGLLRRTLAGNQLPDRLVRIMIQIAGSHHERGDGMGYPKGWVGAAIPLAARIVAVADAYDALRSERPYKRAWSRDDALHHIDMESGTHFDPQVVAALKQLVEKTRRALPRRVLSAA